MKNNDENFKYGEITNKIIQAFYQVYNEIGYGFEKGIYINALNLVFNNLNLKAEKNREIEIVFNNQKIGVYKADLVVQEKILVQVFNNEIFNKNIEQKVYNQLKLSKINVALILNFGINPDFKRKQRD